LKTADAIVLPGVGNFSAASKNIAPYRVEIINRVEQGVPLLGVCLGMQLLFTKSREGDGAGLNLLSGTVVKLPNSVKIPHMGWNTLHITKQTDLVESVNEGSYVYFVHSYYPSGLKRDVVAAETTYGVTFPSVVAIRNVYGTQFHPEKSGKTGLKILKNFFNIVKR
jgi:glutamine amidotransferase